MAISQEHLPQLVSGGGTVYTRQRDKIGKVGQIYLDNETGEPSWVTVTTGLFGTSESFAPLNDAQVDGNDILIGYEVDQVKEAPRMDPDGALSTAEEEELYRYYGLSGAGTQTVSDVTGTGTGTGVGTDATVGTGTGVGTDATVGTGQAGFDDAGTTGRDTSGPTTDDAMTRSEEQMNVGTQTRESGRARLRKYVVTENVTQTVPVSHEEVRLEREPITDANRGQALDGPAISEEEHEVTLHEERPVVEKEAVPVERVRVGKETVQEQETVSGDVRKEQIALDDDATDSGTERGGNL